MAVAGSPAPAAPGLGSRVRRPRGSRGASETHRSAWLFLAPALILLGVFLVFPAVYTIFLSFNRGRNGQFGDWVGLRNYEQLLLNDPDFFNVRQIPPTGAIWNNVLWILVYTPVVLGLGLIIAVMATRVNYERLIKAIVFVPQAISATALAIIWLFVYSPDPNIGLLNAILGVAGISPISWLGDERIVNIALIAVGVWAGVGFATVILSAAIKGISVEILEAARTDGANEFQVFRRIILPMVSLPMSVLAVTLIVSVVKLFDLIYVMTSGGPGTTSRVIAFTMYQESFPAGLYGKGAAVAVIMLLILIPIMIFNIRRFRTEAVT
jgi:alpha-glucoside transport system permease protein